MFQPVKSKRKASRRGPPVQIFDENTKRLLSGKPSSGQVFSFRKEHLSPIDEPKLYRTRSYDILNDEERKVIFSAVLFNSGGLNNKIKKLDKING